MIKLGLTGSIGMGKSTTAQMFRDAGIKVHDADKTVHELYKNEAVKPIAELFPSAVIDGAIDRAVLGSIVLSDKGQMRKLEAIVHPLVHQKEREFLVSADQNNERLVVLDVPLLFETAGEQRVDKILVVTADKEVQKTRVLAREGMNEEKLNAILARQIPDAEKRNRADYVLDTGTGIDHARDFVKSLIKELTN